MCFEADKRKNIPRRVSGYKIFTVDSKGRLLGDFAQRQKERERGKWLNEKNFRPTEGELKSMGGERRVGWRVFLWEGSAKRWKSDLQSQIVRVKVRGLLNVGQCGPFGTAILAKEIFIPKE